MKKLIASFVLLLAFAVPSQAWTVHGTAAKAVFAAVKTPVKVVRHPKKHAKKVCKAVAKGVKSVVKHI